MDIGLSSASFYSEVNTEFCVNQMKKIGFEMGEIFLNTPSEYEEKFILELSEQVHINNFKVNSVHAFSSQFEPYLFDKYKRRRDDMMKSFVKVCKAVKMLDAKCYTFHGMRYENFENLDKDHVTEIYDNLSYIAGENGIKLAQENVSWCISSDLRFLELLMGNCKYPVHFTFDIKQACKAGKNPVDYIKVMGKNIVNLHINDRDDKNVCLLPGKGNINYKEIVAELSKVEYSGNGIIEVYRNNYSDYKELYEAKKFIECLFA